MQPVETLTWVGQCDGVLDILDQRQLPEDVTFLHCQTPQQVFEAIRTLAVRGAPAIGVAAAFGLCLALRDIPDDTPLRATRDGINETADYLAASRPTAVNLFWSLNRMQAVAAVCDGSTGQLKQRLLKEARAIQSEDRKMCQAIGRHGADLVPQNGAVLTHCNAGALATAGIGTALAPLYTAHRQGKRFTVYADETRPLLQGARLTAWELTQAGIETVLICDNMAAWLMQQKRIGAIFVGADRIAANGDVANKIGTLGVSILAAHFNVPFYVAAPSSTFDLSLTDGTAIPIEQRSDSEIRQFNGKQIAPDAAAVWNPAFDVTPAAHIAAIITERGLIQPPTRASIAAMFAHRG